jgi:hypothetical protein
VSACHGIHPRERPAVDNSEAAPVPMGIPLPMSGRQYHLSTGSTLEVSHLLGGFRTLRPAGLLHPATDQDSLSFRYLEPESEDSASHVRFPSVHSHPSKFSPRWQPFRITAALAPSAFTWPDLVIAHRAMHARTRPGFDQRITGSEDSAPAARELVADAQNAPYPSSDHPLPGRHAASSMRLPQGHEAAFPSRPTTGFPRRRPTRHPACCTRLHACLELPFIECPTLEDGIRIPKRPRDWIPHTVHRRRGCPRGQCEACAQDDVAMAHRER